LEVIIGPGSKELIYDIQLAVDGDILLPVPSWVSYAPQSSLTSDHIFRIATTLKDSYHVTPDSLEAAVVNAKKDGLNPTKLILNYPNNPSGLSLTPDRLDQIAGVCRKYSLLVISDEIYGLIHHSGNHTSIARFYPEGTIITTGLSKHLSLGGYRLGIAMIPKYLKPVANAVARVASETWSSVSAPIQYAALKAFEDNPEIEAYIQTCSHIHRLVSGYVRDAVVGLGVQYPILQGGFYMYPDFGRYRRALTRRGIETSLQLSMELLDSAHLATLPGTAFNDSPEHIRLRLAMCDYDGKAAVDYYQQHPDCPAQEIVQSCCPNIQLACERLTGYFGSLVG
jgi:aspartate aminotransferase